MTPVEAPPFPGYCVDKQCECHSNPAGFFFRNPGMRLPFEHDGLPAGCCRRCGRRGPKPMTIIPPVVEVTRAEMLARLDKTRREHEAVLQAYHNIWYECDHTWVSMAFCGIGVMKAPTDMWAYQELIAKHRPRTIIETGTYQGGSALWFAFLMDILQIEGGRVLTIDLDDHRRCSHPRITFVGGDSTNPALAAAVLAEVEANVKGPVLVCLDSDHSAAHVRKEMELYAPACAVGDWLVVEDTNISWGGPDGDRGAQGGVEDYIRAHEGEFRQDLWYERMLLTMNPGGWLQRVMACPHD